MLPLKRVGGFFLRLLLAYGLLLAAWPVLQGAYSASYRSVGNAAFRPSVRQGKVSFLPGSEADKKMDTTVRIENWRTGFANSIPLSSRLMGYMPTAVAISLILATPLPWSRRWKALLYGLILVHGLVLFRVGILILNGYCGTDPAALQTSGPFWGTVLPAASSVIATSPGFAFAAPILVWILATFRRGDFGVVGQLGLQRPGGS